MVRAHHVTRDREDAGLRDSDRSGGHRDAARVPSDERKVRFLDVPRLEMAEDPLGRRARLREQQQAGGEPVDAVHGVQDLRDLYTESGQTLKGSFSAVPKPKFAGKQ